ncbi:MAG: hypothetical protein JWR88_2064 [Pseudonocardia sp.]|nr:hypothetical protein [Pseudonocardia sp.]
MKIALLTYSTRPRGSVVHTLALAEALARSGAEVAVWTLGRGGDVGFFRAVDPAVRLQVIAFPDVPDESVGERVLRSIDVMRSAFRPHDYDVVHAQDCISANAAGRCIRTVHHIDSFSTPELAACHERAIVEPFAHVCVSAAVAGELARGWGIEASVIGNGVDAQRFAVAASADPTATAAREGWRRRLGPYVLAVGGIEPRKGTLDLVEAYALLRPQHPDLALVVAGGETLFDYRDYRAAVDTRAAELGVQLTVLGPVDHDELPALVAAAQAFAFPSTKEGFGLAAMEALAAGVPLVTRDLLVLREVFGSAPLFASDPLGFARQLARVLDGDATTVQRRERGRRIAGQHSWDAAAAAHLELYRRCAAYPLPHG